MLHTMHMLITMMTNLSNQYMHCLVTQELSMTKLAHQHRHCLAT